jgi:hypothetical protein
MPRDLALLCVDADLAHAEEHLDLCRGWLKRSRGAGRVRAQEACDEAMVEVQRLTRERLRLAGAEICLLPGGKS